MVQFRTAPIASAPPAATAPPSASTSSSSNSIPSSTNDSAMEEEDPELARALRLSQEATILGEEKAAEQRRLDDDQLKNAIAASLGDADLARRRYEKEQADLEHAIALSMAIEQEKMKLLESKLQAEVAAQTRAAQQESKHSGQTIDQLNNAVKQALSEGKQAKARAAELRAQEQKKHQDKLASMRQAKQQNKSKGVVQPDVQPTPVVAAAAPAQPKAKDTSPSKGGGRLLGDLPSLNPVRRVPPQTALVELGAQQKQLKVCICDYL